MKKHKHTTRSSLSFIENIRPKKDKLPLDELKGRFAEKTRQKTGYMPYGDMPHGIDHLAELRIRAWLSRDKTLDDEIRKDAGHENDIAKNTQKITPPKI